MVDRLTAYRREETDLELGEDFGAGLTAREVDWLVEHEWARTVDDILWRRTKLGLTGQVDESRLQAYLDRR